MRDRDWAELKRQAAQLRLQGFSLRQIGRRLDVRSGVVARWVADVPFGGFSDAALAEQLQHRRDQSVYERAVALRREGWSYTMIAAELGVAKSTLSGWLKDLPSTRSEAAKRSHRARIQTSRTKQLQHQAALQVLVENAQAEMRQRFANGLTDRELFVAGLMLYWAEGRKTHSSVEIANSDPRIIKIFVRWVEQCFNINREQLRACIHVYPDIDVDVAENYWAEVIGIPRTQFYRAQIDVRAGKSPNKRGKLAYGTAHIKVGGSGAAALHRNILAWIAGFSECVLQ